MLSNEIGVLIGCLNEGKSFNPLYNVFIHGHQIILSKSVADKYALELIDFYNKKLVAWGEQPVGFEGRIKKDYLLEEADDRIETALTAEEIRDYFNQLLKQHKGKPILTPDQLENFLAANFKAFKEIKPRVLIKTTIPKNALQYFIYYFYFRHDKFKSGGKKKDYCELLMLNFECFSNDEPGTLYKLFSRKPKTDFFLYRSC